jgi:glutaminase
MPVNLPSLIGAIVAEARGATERGKVADYIPSLAAIDPARFGIAIVTADGDCHVGGDGDVPFSIQSISKVFALTMALNQVGSALWTRVGVEPSGSAFNSIVQLESERGIPRNPFINAGAIVVADVVLGTKTPEAAIADLVGSIRYLVGDEAIAVDESVARSESATGFRNIALANYIKSFANLDHRANDALDVYFHQCGIAMSCRQLAMAGRFLMHDGHHPVQQTQVITPVRARRILALMLTCGHYDGSGEFAFRVGMPGKSGVGGGILAIVPGKASIATWSPGLNARGNSKLGSEALERLAAATNWSVFTPS